MICEWQKAKHLCLTYSSVYHSCTLLPYCCLPSCINRQYHSNLHTYLLLSYAVQGSSSSSPAHPASLCVHGFAELVHLTSDSPQSQASLHWAAAYQDCLQLQGHAQQCFTAEVLPVLMAHYASGLGPSTSQVRTGLALLDRMLQYSFCCQTDHWSGICLFCTVIWDSPR